VASVAVRLITSAFGWPPKGSCRSHGVYDKDFAQRNGIYNYDTS
jgi:hypothetical protein